MPTRKLFWFAVAILTAVLMAAAPPAGFCEDTSQLDIGDDQPIGYQPEIIQALGARALPELNPDGEPPIVFAFSKAAPYTKALSGYAGAYIFQPSLADLYAMDESEMDWPDRTCTEYINTSLSAAVVDTENQGKQVIANVVGTCSRQPLGTQGRLNPATRTTAWVPLDLQGSGEYDALATDSRVVGGTLYQVICGANDSGVNCWDPGVMLNTPLPSQEWTVAGGGKIISNLGLRYDKYGNVHMVGTTSDGDLSYTRFPVGSTQSDADSYMNLGQVSGNKSWKWPQVGVAPNGTIYVAAFNPLEGNLYVFYKAADSADHWYFLVVSSSGGPMGMYLSMAVDNQTNNALMTYADTEGYARNMTVTPNGHSRTDILEPRYGQPYSTATTAGNGSGNSLYCSTYLDAIAARIGVKLLF